jgi:ankyrin repeat protein
VTPPLLIVAKSGKIDCMRMLLQAGADVTQQDGSGRKALHLVSWFGHSEAIPLLLEKNADVSDTDDAGMTALHIACWFDQFDACRYLIGCGAPVNATDNSGRTPLHFAVQHNRPAFVRLLLESKANPRVKDGDGKTPEGIAATENETEILDIFTSFAPKEEENPEFSGLIAESARLHDTLAKLVAERDKFADRFSQLQSRVQSFESQVMELQQRFTNLSVGMATLRGKLAEIVALAKGEDTSRAKGALVYITQPGPPPAPRPDRMVPLCEACKTNPGAWRCKTCHSPFCMVCLPDVKKDGCAICRRRATRAA